MKFGEAVDTVLVKNYFNFKGKASRSEYWWFLLFMIISGFAASLIEIIAVSASQGSSFNQENFYPSSSFKKELNFYSFIFSFH